jgi:Holliday junction resolvasome RuvABC endonuclease subunit
MIYIGIDPGLSGGIAALSESGLVIEAIHMPATEADILKALERSRILQPARAVLEHVWSVPGQGGAFKFGRNVGHCEMALTSARIPFDQITPQRWQKAMGVVYPKGSNDTVKKNITKRRAQQLFPEVVTITHAIADALLLAEYCRRREQGTDGKEAKDHKEARAQATSAREAPRRRQQGNAESGRRTQAHATRSPTARDGALTHRSAR